MLKRLLASLLVVILIFSTVEPTLLSSYAEDITETAYDEAAPTDEPTWSLTEEPTAASSEEPSNVPATAQPAEEPAAAEPIKPAFTEEPMAKPATQASAVLLRLNARGEDVRRLQQALADLGYLHESLVNGVFGEETKAALMLFQQDNQLDIDGIAGPQTYAVLYDGSPALYADEPVSEGQGPWNYFPSASGSEQEAEVTDSRGEAEDPADADEPGEADEPTDTDELGEAEDPADTDEPGEADEPTDTDEPGEAEDPADADESTGTDELGEAEDPADTDEPGEAQDPTDTDGPGETEDPIDTDEPGEAEDPADTDEPEDADEPTDMDEPEGTEGSVGAKDPAETDDLDVTNGIESLEGFESFGMIMPMGFFPVEPDSSSGGYQFSAIIYDWVSGDTRDPHDISTPPFTLEYDGYGDYKPNPTFLFEPEPSDMTGLSVTVSGKFISPDDTNPIITVTKTIPNQTPGQPGWTVRYVFDVSSNEYTVHVTGNDVKTGEVDSGSFSGKKLDGGDIILQPIKDISFSVYWNDNNDEGDVRPSDGVIYYLKDGYDNFVTDAHNNKIAGIVGTDSYNQKTVTFPGMEEFDANGDEIQYTMVQEFADEEVKSKFNSNYISEPIYDENGSFAGIRNTKKTGFSIYKHWRDLYHHLGETTNPVDTDLWRRDYMTLWRKIKGSDGAPDKVTDFSWKLEDTESSKWTLVTEDLPEFAPDGMPYEYWYEENITGLNDELQGIDFFEDADHSFVPSVRNVSPYGTMVNPTEVYPGGTLRNTLESTTDFTFTKRWEDDQGNALDTSELEDVVVSFYLYRFPASMADTLEGGADAAFDLQAPVGGHDSWVWNDGKWKDFAGSEFGDAQSYLMANEKWTGLPRYDEYGDEYVYYIREVLSGAKAGLYESVIDNSGTGFPSEKDYVVAGGKITNRQRPLGGTGYEKTWNARVLQGMRGSVKLRLEQQGEDGKWIRVKEENGTDLVKDITVPGFRGEAFTQRGVFTYSSGNPLPEYDENNQKITYRVIEVGATLDGTDWENFNDDESEGYPDPNPMTLELNGRKYQIQVAYGETGEITNTLVGETEIKVKKIWSPSDGVPEDAWIEIQLVRKSGKSADDDADGYFQIVTDLEADHLSGNLAFKDGSTDTFIMTAPWDEEGLFQNLPKYDPEGYEYVYEVREINTSILPEGSHFDRIEYERGEDGVKRADIYNVYGDGGGWRFEVEKRWLDDEDISRRPGYVTVGLFYNGGDSLTPVAGYQNIPINEGMGWHRLVHVPQEMVQELSTTYPGSTRDDFVIREVGTTGDSDNYSFRLLTDPEVDGTGQAVSDHHAYEVFTDAFRANEWAYDHPGFRVTNRRVGLVEAEATKDWNVGALEELIPDGMTLTAQFVLMNGEEKAAAGDLDLAGDTVILENENGEAAVPKYDGKGKLIPYSLREVSLTFKLGENEQVLPFENHQIPGEDILAAIQALPGGSAVEWPVAASSFVLSFSDAQTITYGKENQHWPDPDLGSVPDPDKISAAFTNQLGGTTPLMIRKVWLDGGKGGDPRRPDISLTLKRGIAGKPDEPNFREYIQRWHSGENYIWENHFGEGYPLFDGDGNRYEYRVRETIVQSGSEYKGYYLAADKRWPDGEQDSKTVYPEADEDSAILISINVSDEDGNKSFAVARSGNEGDRPDTIVNRLEGQFVFLGIKIWLQIPAWFRQVGRLPKVHLQLIRKLDADTDWKKVDGVNVTLPADQYYPFNYAYTLPTGSIPSNPVSDENPGVQKYDPWGILYHYAVRETILNNLPEGSGGKDPALLYNMNNNFSSGLISNTFNSDEKVALNIVKTWNWTGKQTGQDTYPDVNFDIYQVWTSPFDAALSHTHLLTTKTLKRVGEGEIPPYNDPGDWTFTLQVDDLPKYAPDGSLYEYFVVERPIGGYGSTSDDTYGTNDWAKSHIFGYGTSYGDHQLVDVPVIDAEDLNDAKFTNTYTNDGDNELVFTKSWADQGNTWGTRPVETDPPDGAVSFKLIREAAPSIKEDVTTDSQSINRGTNPWTITFTGNFPTHHTNGNLYTYKVVEILDEPYNTYYAKSGTGKPIEGMEGTPTTSGNSLTNTLKTVNLVVDKSWINSNDNKPLDKKAMQELYDLGVLPASVDFVVQRRASDDDDAWEDVYLGDENTDDDKLVKRTVSGQELLNHMLNELYIQVTEGEFKDKLPEYQPASVSGTGDAAKWQYRVVERNVDGGMINEPGDPEVEGKVSKITNSMPTRKLFFVKDWVDDNNRDDSRPSEIEYKLTWTAPEPDGKTYEVLVKLSLATESSDTDDRSNVESGTGRNKNRWVADFTVPDFEDDSISVTEIMEGMEEYRIINVTKDGDFFSFTNEREEITPMSVSATKTWAGDEDWASQTRPEEVTVRLWVKGRNNTWIDLSKQTTSIDSAGGMPFSDAAVKTIVKGTAEPYWTATAIWDNLPVYAPKTEQTADVGAFKYQYRVSEDKVPGYTTSYQPREDIGSSGPNSVERTVKNTLETIKVEGMKTWVDDNDRYGMRMSASKFKDQLTLLADPSMDLAGAVFEWIHPTSGKTLSDDTEVDKLDKSLGWKYRFSNLPKFKVSEDGKSFTSVTYTVKEDKIPDYKTTETDAGFTNTLETVSIPVKKSWAGDGYFEEFARPSQLGLKLYKVVSLEGGATEQVEVTQYPDKTPTLSSPEWEYTFTGLPKYEKGTDTPIEYIVKEAVPAGYRAVQVNAEDEREDYDAGSSHGEMIEFRNELKTLELEGTKAWDDLKYKGLTRPDDLELTVKYRVKGSEDDTWKSTLPFVQPEGGYEVEGVNTYWEDKTGDSWNYKFVGLPTHDASGNELEYAVEETVPAGYSSSENPKAVGADGKANFENELKTLEIEGTKTWADQGNKYSTRPDNLMLTVKFREEDSEEDWRILEPQPEGGFTSSIEYWKDKIGDRWDYKFVGLPTHNKAGKRIIYAVEETPVNGYDVSSPNPNGGTVGPDGGDVKDADFTNTLLVTDVYGTKTWDDFGNKYLRRLSPEEMIEKILIEPMPQMKDGETLDFEWLSTEDDTWTFVIRNLPATDGEGNEISYTLREAEKPGFTPEYDDETGDITNRLKLKDVPGSKTWDDQDNKYGTRLTPEALRDKLVLSPKPDLKPGEELDFEWTRSEGNDWSFVFKNLPAEDAEGKEIFYTVSEQKVPGYKTDPGEESNSFTNSLITVSISGMKTWEDQSNKHLTRPDELELTLLADDEPMDSGLISPEWNKPEGADAWTYRFSGLPRFKAVDGQEVDIIYTVKETRVADYQPGTEDAVSGNSDESGNVSGADFVNTLYTIDLKGSKTWDDLDDQYLMRPENLELTLLSDGLPTEMKPEWTKDGKVWRFEYKGLPRYKKGTATPVVYTVTEAPVAGYMPHDDQPLAGTVDAQTGNVTAIDFTNTLKLISIKGSKTWVDNNDSRGRRPADLGLTLYADGKEIKLTEGRSPELRWNKQGSVWTFEYSGLPRYRIANGKETEISYTVKETLMNRYRPTITGAIGGQADPETGDVTGIDFTNTYDSDYVVPQTGDMIWLPLGLMALSGIAFIVLYRRRKRALAG